VSYNTIIEMAGSSSLIDRSAAAAAQEGAVDPVQWAHAHIWLLAAAPGWADAWASATAACSVNVNPDTGQRDDVITDGMILAEVQAVMAEEAAPAEPLADLDDQP
jgi:hypothetical protein